MNRQQPTESERAAILDILRLYGPATLYDMMYDAIATGDDEDAEPGTLEHACHAWIVALDEMSEALGDALPDDHAGGL